MEINIPMKHIVYVTGLLSIYCAISFVNSCHADNMLTLNEKTSLLDRIISQDSKIENLHVTFKVIVTKNSEPPIQSIYEWAKSGEKSYRKHTFYQPVNEPPTERYGIAVWDGKYLKAYDSGFDNGSVRNVYNPNDPGSPVTITPYTRLLGSQSKGSLAEYLSRLELEDWDAKWRDSGKEVVLHHGNSSGYREWTLDLEKNCMVCKFDHLINYIENKSGLNLKMTVLESEEMKLGIWLPTKSNIHSVIYRPDKLVIDNDIVVEEIKVNELEIEKLFHFEFPEKSQYYDYIIDKAFIPHLTEKEIQRQLDEMAEEVMEVKNEEGYVNETSISGSIETDKKEMSKEKDDFITADNLIQEEVESTSYRSWSWYYILATFIFIIAVVILLYVLVSRRKVLTQNGKQNI